jgi:hypothetical protein
VGALLGTIWSLTAANPSGRRTAIRSGWGRWAWPACRVFAFASPAKTGDDQAGRLAIVVVVGTGVDPVTFRFSGGRSAN